jgi:hypothetical protein
VAPLDVASNTYGATRKQLDASSSSASLDDSDASEEDSEADEDDDEEVTASNTVENTAKRKSNFAVDECSFTAAGRKQCCVVAIIPQELAEKRKKVVTKSSLTPHIVQAHY